MALPMVAQGQPHVPAHNDERDAINGILADYVRSSDLTAAVTAAVEDLAGAVLTLEQYGAVLDGITDDSTAFQAALNAAAALTTGGGLVKGTPGKKMKLGSATRIVWPTGAWFDGGGGGKQSGAHQSFQIVADSTLTGWIIDTASTSQTGLGLKNCRITTSGLPAGVLGGIRFQHVVYGMIENVIVDGVTDTAFKIAGTGNIVRNCGGSYNVSGRTLTQPCGVMQVNGTDQLIEACEMSAGASAITYSQLYQCAYYVNCLTSWFIANEGEFGECGWYIDGPQSGGSGLGTSGAYLCRFIGSRATYNVGHGFYLAGACSYNEFTDTYVYNCSQAGDGLYDGFYLANGSIGTRIGKLSGASNNVPGFGGGGPGGRFYMMRYLYNDQNATWTGDQANRVDDVWGQADNVTVDICNSASAAVPMKPATGAAVAVNRDKSRYHVGQTMYDLTMNKLMIATNAAWFDPVLGKKTQINQMTPTYSECRQPSGATGSTATTAWVSGHGTLTVEQKILMSSVVQSQFATPQVLQVVANAGAVTANQCDINTGSLSLVVDPTQDFSVGAHVLCGALSTGTTATFTFAISWYTSGVVFISTTSGLASSTVGLATQVEMVADVAAASVPATAAFAVVSIVAAKTGMVAGVDKFYLSSLWAGQGAIPHFVPA